MNFNNAQTWHILSLCLFPAINALGITASIFLSKSKTKLPLSMGVIFSAGVLLSAALVHMLPHAVANLEGFQLFASDEEHHEELEILNRTDAVDNVVDHVDHYDDRLRKLEDEDHHGEAEEEHAHPFPWAFTFFGIAFLVLLCVEASMERFIDTHFAGKQGNFFHSHDDHDGESHDHVDEEHGAHSHDDHKVVTTNTDPTERSAEGSMRTAGGPSGHDDANHPGKEKDCLPCNVEKIREMGIGSSVLEEDEIQTDLESPFPSSQSRRSLYTTRRRSSAWSKFAPRPSTVAYIVSAPKQQEEEDKTKQTINPWVSILLTLVLSIHVVLEGLTIGSSSDVNTIQTTFLAVVVHKGFAAFSLGSSLIASGYWGEMEGGSKKMFFVLAGVYASVDVIALGTGMALGAAFEATGSFSGILQALLGGSFLFVSAVELIPGELEKMRNFNLPLVPLLGSLLSGFVLMTTLGMWV